MPFTAEMPARSSAATAFQLSANSRRSDIDLRRAAARARGFASGSRTEA